MAGSLAGLALVLALVVGAAACGADATGARPDAAGPTCPPPVLADAPTLPPVDVVSRADAVAAASDVPSDAGIDAAVDTGGPDWRLPPCETACDRVVDCAVFGCPGFEWTTAGLLASGCHEVCDEGFVAAVAAASDCDTLFAGPGAGVEVLSEMCENNPCDFLCGRLAGCLVDECPAIDGSAEATIREDCVRTCDPDDVAWVSSFPTCADLVGTISQADAAFREVCLGVPEECADPVDCDPYGARIAACLVESCHESVAEYEAGLRWAFSDFCRASEPCASARDVGAVLDPALTCADPPLSDLGAISELAPLCRGASGVGPAAVREACGEVLACTGTGWLPDEDACMALIVLRPDTAAITACLRAASGCGELFECFEEGGR